MLVTHRRQLRRRLNRSRHDGARHAESRVRGKPHGARLRRKRFQKAHLRLSEDLDARRNEAVHVTREHKTGFLNPCVFDLPRQAPFSRNRAHHPGNLRNVDKISGRDGRKNRVARNRAIVVAHHEKIHRRRDVHRGKSVVVFYRNPSS